MDLLGNSNNLIEKWLALYFCLSTIAAPAILFLLSKMSWWPLSGDRAIKVRVPPPLEHADPNRLRSRASRIINSRLASRPIDGLLDPNYQHYGDKAAPPSGLNIHVATIEKANYRDISIRLKDGEGRRRDFAKILSSFGQRVLWPFGKTELIRLPLDDYRALEEASGEFYWQKTSKGWRVLPPGKFTFMHLGPLYSLSFWFLAVPFAIMLIVTQVTYFSKTAGYGIFDFDSTNNVYKYFLACIPLILFLFVPILANIIVHFRLLAIINDPPYMSGAFLQKMEQIRAVWRRYGFDDSGRRNTGMHDWMVKVAWILKVAVPVVICAYLWGIHKHGISTSEWWKHISMFVPIGPLMVFDMWLASFFPIIYGPDIGIHDRVIEDASTEVGDGVDRLMSSLESENKIRRSVTRVQPSSDIKLQNDFLSYIGENEYYSALDGAEGFTERTLLFGSRSLTEENRDLKTKAIINSFRSLVPNTTPTGWQLEAVEQWEQHHDMFLEVFPGGGKTTTMNWLALLNFQLKGMHSLIICPDEKDAHTVAGKLEDAIQTMGIEWCTKISLFTKSHHDREMNRLKGGIAIDRY